MGGYRQGRLLTVLAAALCCIGCWATPGHALKPSRRSLIAELPGWTGPLPSDHFTGYIPVHGGSHHLFYWLVTSHGSPSRDPVVLWLTGGPGCSSLDALVYEHGPFTFTRHSSGKIKLTRNPYAWSTAATVIYVDSPIGTGLSYSHAHPPNTTTMNDETTTDDLLDFITQLLTQDFPELAGNELYIAGESYGGVYVPLLASKLLDYNARVGPARRLNLQGYLIGNGVTDDEFDGNGQAEFAYGFGLIDPSTYAQLRRTCRDSFWNATPGSECADELRDAYRRFYWLNPYDILDDCYVPHHDAVDAASSSASSRQRVALSAGPHPIVASHQHPAPVLAAFKPPESEGGFQLHWPLAGVRGGPRGRRVATRPGLLGHTIPCADRRISLTWLNQQAVRDALHAVPAAELNWQPCSDVLHYEFTDISIIPYHRRALDQGLRVLIYSGDHDFVVPFTGTRAWVFSLGLEPLHPYGTWSVDGQVAGFTIRFKGGLQFATVKGAGHMVPQSSPRNALRLFMGFLFEEGPARTR